jgi:hypothetical protein
MLVAEKLDWKGLKCVYMAGRRTFRIHTDFHPAFRRNKIFETIHFTLTFVLNHGFQILSNKFLTNEFTFYNKYCQSPFNKIQFVNATVKIIDSYEKC